MNKITATEKHTTTDRIEVEKHWLSDGTTVTIKRGHDLLTGHRQTRCFAQYDGGTEKRITLKVATELLSGK